MYKVEIFSDQFIYKSMAMVDETTTAIEQDFLTYDSNTIQTPLIDCEKGDLIHITDQNNNYVADGIIADVQPGNKAQEITIRPLNALFDTEVFYTAVTDCITWLATNIDNAFMSNTDTLQNRPITLTYTTSADTLPLTGFNLHETVNILSVMVSAMKTYGVVVASRLDLPNKRFTVNIYQQTATKTLEASLKNVLQKSVTIGDSYGSTNKAIIRKIRVVDDVTTVLGQTEFYLHPNGTIDTTDGNRIVPVFWELESLELDDDMTESEWQAAALSRAKEILTPAKYDNEIVLQYDRDDLLARPADLLIGTATTIYLDGNTYASILTGKRIEGQKITLIFGVTRTELTKQLSIKQRETLTYQNTVSAINKIVEKRIAGGGGSVEPTTTTPKMDGTAAVGSETAYARGDHVHPTDTSRVAKAGDTMTGTLIIKSPNFDLTDNPPASGNAYALPISWYDKNGVYLASARPLRTAGDVLAYRDGIQREINGSTYYNFLSLGVDENGDRSVTVSDAAAWRSALGAAPLASPAFTGNPTAPTQSAGNNSTRLATTAFVYNEVHGMRILGTQLINFSTSASVAVGSTGTATGTITAVTGATEYIVLPSWANYCTINNVTRSNLTLTATLRNISNAAHTLAASVRVLALG